MIDDEIDFVGEVRRLLQADGYAVHGGDRADDPELFGRFWFSWMQPGMAEAEVGPTCETEPAAWTTALTHRLHDARDVGAAIASGSFQSHAMVIAPCSMRTLAAVAHGLADNLITRAADVMLKERRRLVLLARETPLNLAHLRNMVSVTEMGAIVFPPVPAFYQRPQTVAEIVDHTVARVIDLLDLPNALAPRWDGLDMPTDA
jgi:polyprenyl P-hydroxybenzoate/phenylacrylic acid decarboxylase-like protein